MIAQNTFPALTGDVVTERHARICADKGHATHTIDGIVQDRCPRCGELRVTATPDMSKTYARMLALELEIGHNRVMAEFGATYAMRSRNAQRFAKNREELNELFDSLTLGQLREYGDYRRP